MSRYRRISVCLEEEEEECILRRFVNTVIAERKFVLRKGVAPSPPPRMEDRDLMRLISLQVLDRRDIWRQDKLDRLVRNNHLHCTLKPIYGADVLKALTLPSKVITSYSSTASSSSSLSFPCYSYSRSFASSASFRLPI